MVLIPQEAVDLIVSHEVSSRAEYDRIYHLPIKPGLASGITVMIGYDVGQGVRDRDQLQADLGGRVKQHMIDALAKAIGKTGDAAQRLLPEMRRVVDIPWDVAMDVFINVTVPRWYAICARNLPNYESLPPLCKGALLSLTYNRGASYSMAGDRYKEMRAIRAHMEAKRFDLIPQEIMDMKRIWRGQGQDGLLRRRDAEAEMFAKGLKEPVAGAVVTGTASVAVGTVVAAASSGYIGWGVALAIVLALALGLLLLTMRPGKGRE